MTDTTQEPKMSLGFHPARYTFFDRGKRTQVKSGVIDESQICLFVNGQVLATFMCSPLEPKDLALGFLRSEGLIDSPDDIRAVHVAENNCVDVWLNHEIETPKQTIITAGCGGGVTFDDLAKERAPLDSTLVLSSTQISALMKQMLQRAELYNAVRGVHTSALCERDSVLFVAQDIGRHNTIDRLWGMSMQRGVDTRDKIIVASGRISSEMLNKAAKMGVPIVISRTSPTSLSVALGKAWKICVVGYCRGNQFRVYSTEERIQTYPPKH
jgi:FdhD protein